MAKICFSGIVETEVDKFLFLPNFSLIFLNSIYASYL